ncbi:BPI fold-containing family B member 6-like [Erythrolamprus reginae]|uniref:BPI fold-containing family B member 6-like n=1 Tax=Erythrolamprus reginae TaxID=121349 RepID=UPI00396CEC88
MDYLVLKRPWLGVLVFFCIAMVPSESGDTCIAKVKLPPETMMRMVQVSMIQGNILQNMVEKAMKNGDNSKMIKGIKGLKIQDLCIPNTDMELMPTDTMKLRILINITVSGKSFIGGNMQITVVAELQIYVQISVCPKGKVITKITGCKVIVISCKTNLPSSMLPKIVNKFLDSTLGKVMPGVLCPAADMIIEKQMVAFQIMLGKKAIGIIGFIVYEVAEKPDVQLTFIHISIKITIQNKKGERKAFDYDQLPDKLPPSKDKMCAVYIPATAVSSVIDLMKPHLNTVVPKVKGAVPTSDQLKKLLPKAGLPAGKKLKVKITHTESPKVTISSSASSLTTSIEASFVDAKKGNQILSIKMKHKCRITFAIKQEHLTISLKKGACRTVEVSSPAGDVTGASKYTESVMDSWVQHATSVMNKNQVPLPSIMNVTSTTSDATLSFHDNFLVIESNIQQYSKEEMAREVKKQCSTIKL